MQKLLNNTVSAIFKWMHCNWHVIEGVPKKIKRKGKWNCISRWNSKVETWQLFELCITCGFLELDCSHSLADIFLLEIDLPKTLNNQCFYNCCIKERPITWIKVKKCPLSKTETCVLLFQVLCHSFVIQFIRYFVDMNLI